MFIDEATIQVKAGDGGAGCVAFRREKHVPRGGPSGGDGGAGGSIYLLADHSIATLMDVTQRARHEAKNGHRGSGHLRSGKSAPDIIIRLPVGTIVHDVDRAVILKDMVKDGERLCVARGGRGGHGNKHFATAINQTPRVAEPGGSGQERTLHLELKLVADVGLLGMPNAGKSTLLSRLSSAHPKIAAYPFTTLHPQLGIVEGPDFERFVMADLPGLIEGAHRGVGLGDEFLRHIERTRLLVHLVEAEPLSGAPGPDVAYRQLRHELVSYSKTLAERPEIVVATKMDLSGAQAGLKLLRQTVDKPVYAISAVTGAGLRELVLAIVVMLKDLRQEVDSPSR